MLDESVYWSKYRSGKKQRWGDDAAKYLFKLFTNAVFGKNTGNLRNRINLDVVTSRSNIEEGYIEADRETTEF